MVQLSRRNTCQHSSATSCASWTRLSRRVSSCSCRHSRSQGRWPLDAAIGRPIKKGGSVGALDHLILVGRPTVAHIGCSWVAHHCPWSIDRRSLFRAKQDSMYVCVYMHTYSYANGVLGILHRPGHWPRNETALSPSILTGHRYHRNRKSSQDCTQRTTGVGTGRYSWWCVADAILRLGVSKPGRPGSGVSNMSNSHRPLASGWSIHGLSLWYCSPKAALAPGQESCPSCDCAQTCGESGEGGGGGGVDDSVCTKRPGMFRKAHRRSIPGRHAGGAESAPRISTHKASIQTNRVMHLSPAKKADSLTKRKSGE